MYLKTKLSQTFYIATNYKNMMKLDFKKTKNIISLALKEDIGNKDITTESCIPKKLKAKATIISEQKGILCGTQLISFIYKTIGKKAKIKLYRWFLLVNRRRQGFSGYKL